MKNLEINIEKLDHYGRGITKVNGFPIFVENALPDEKIKIELINEKKKFCEAKTVEIIKESPFRVIPLCPYYDECGGCNIMHISYQQQLQFKENKVKEVLKKFADFDNVKKIISTDNFYYRNKVTLKVKENIGYYKKKSYEIVPISKCLIADDRINKIIDKLNSINLSNIQEVVIRVSNKQTMLVFYCNKDVTIDVNYFEDVDTIICCNNGKKILKGNGNIEEEINGIKFIVSPTSFFQVNTNGMINLYNKVLEYANLKGNEKILDLYCGTGTIGIYLSKYCGKVFGIEISEEAIHDALLNKEINDVGNIDFKAGDVKEILKKNKFMPDIIVVDPPRAGLDKKVIEEINSLNPQKLIYVSCDAITLARDLNLLKEKFDIIECSPVDMFPNTYHVETVVLLSREK